jgi:hypothetical protein
MRRRKPKPRGGGGARGAVGGQPAGEEGIQVQAACALTISFSLALLIGTLAWAFTFSIPPLFGARLQPVVERLPLFVQVGPVLHV